MKNSLYRFSVFPVVLVLLLVFSCAQQAEKENLENEAKEGLALDSIPKVVMDALKTKFPTAEIHQWTKEKEGDIVLYDFEFNQQDQKFEADITEDGTIHNWEKEIAAEELPEAVMKAVEKMYPKSNLQEIMEITLVKAEQDSLEGYEIVLETAEKQEVEVTVAPDGTILEEDPGE